MTAKRAATAEFCGQVEGPEWAVNGEESLRSSVDAAPPPMAAQSPLCLVLRRGRRSALSVCFLIVGKAPRNDGNQLIG